MIAAIASCHPVIEALESALIDPVATTMLSMIADIQIHGGFVYGSAYAEWKSIDFTREDVAQAIDDPVRAQ